MADVFGLVFLILLFAGAVVGLKIVSRPQRRTAEEFERRAAEGTTALGASMNALQELMNPEAARSKEVQVQMKEGRFQKKKREGKANESLEE